MACMMSERSTLSTGRTQCHFVCLWVFVLQKSCQSREEVPARELPAPAQGSEFTFCAPAAPAWAALQGCLNEVRGVILFATCVCLRVCVHPTSSQVTKLMLPRYMQLVCGGGAPCEIPHAMADDTEWFQVCPAEHIFVQQMQQVHGG